MSNFFASTLIVSLTILISASVSQAQALDQTVKSDSKTSAELTKQYDQSVVTYEPEPSTGASVSRMAVPVDPVDPGGGSGGGSGGGGSDGSGSQWAYENMDARMNIQTGVTEHTTELLGDRVNGGTGALTFSNTDISIPGNFSIPVTLRRSFKGILYAHYNPLDVGDWMIDIPHVYTTLVRNRTRYSGEWGQGRECSGSLNPGEIAYFGDTYMNYDYWNGDVLNVPGRTNERLLENLGKYASQADYPKVTQSGWRISCADNASTGGERFIAQAPNGDTYTFAQLRLIETEVLEKGTKPIPRFHAFMLVTKIEDVHGNSVHYRYNAEGQLKKIESSDGRLIELNYDNDGRLQSAAAGQRQWQYHYTGNTLSRVTRPDGKSWHYDLYEMGLKRPSSQGHCNQRAGNETFTVSVTHPNGLVGHFRLGEQRFGRANVRSMYSNGIQLNGICFVSMALKEKRLSGPRLQADLVWSYRYSGRAGYYSSTTPNESERLQGSVPSGINRYETRRTQIVLPDDSVQYLFYNRDFSSVFESQLVGKQMFSDGGTTLLEEVTFSYEAGVLVGRTMQMLDNVEDDEYQALLTQKKINRRLSSDDIYITQYSNFTLLGSPTLEIQSGNAGSRRIERTYRQIKARWILDLPAHTSVGNASETHRTYNQYGELTSITSNGVTESYDYSTGLLTKRTSPRGFVTTYHNYYRGIPRRITTSDGSEYREVSSYGDMTSYTNKIGAETTYRYDTLGRLTKKTPALGNATTVNYGNNQYTVTRGQHRRVYQLDGLNRRVLLTDTDLSGGNKRYQRWRYHKNGQLGFRSVVSDSSSTSDGVSFEYDGLGRLIRKTDPYGTTSWRYLSNNRVRKTDPRNYQSTTYLESYASPADAMRVRIDAPSSSGTVTTSMEYDAAGRVLSVSQAGSSILYRYDDDFGDYLASEQYPAFTINYARDAAGNMTQRWVNSGSRTYYTYDHNNQLTEIDYPGSTPDVNFAYREDGVMTSAMNGVGDWRYQYNTIGQLTQSELVYESANYQFNYSYDSARHLSALSYPGGYSVSYSPDSRGQATRAGSLVTSVQRHPNGAVARMDYGNGLHAYRLFDSAGLRTTQIQVKNGNTFKLRKVYEYDAAGNVVSIDDRQHASYDVRNFEYDGLNRLLSVYSPSFGTIGYQYDKRGNITRLTQAGQSQSYHYSSNDSLSSVTGAVSRAFSYDNAGRVINNGQITMSYNTADQMVSAGTERYQYDAHGHRLTKPSEGAARLTIYNRDGQVLMTRQNGENTYKVLLDGKAVGQTGNGGTRYLHYDVLGSVVAESTSSGSLKKQHYRPFGLQVDAYNSPNEQGYTGHVQDDTGLVYMQARYYDPVIGRFYSNDPKGTASFLSEGKIQGFNRYAYAANNPYKYVDPDGRDYEETFLSLKVPFVGAVDVGTVGFKPNASGQGNTTSGLFVRFSTSASNVDSDVTKGVIKQKGAIAGLTFGKGAGSNTDQNFDAPSASLDVGVGVGTVSIGDASSSESSATVEIGPSLGADATVSKSFTLTGNDVKQAAQEVKSKIEELIR